MTSDELAEVTTTAENTGMVLLSLLICYFCQYIVVQ